MSHSVKIFWLCALSFIIRNYILLTSFIETSRDRERSKSLTPACRPESSGNYWFIYFFFFFFSFPHFYQKGLRPVWGVWPSLVQLPTHMEDVQMRADVKEDVCIYRERHCRLQEKSVRLWKKIREFLFIPYVERTGYPRRVYPGMRSARGE